MAALAELCGCRTSVFRADVSRDAPALLVHWIPGRVHSLWSRVVDTSARGRRAMEAWRRGDSGLRCCCTRCTNEFRRVRLSVALLSFLLSEPRAFPLLNTRPADVGQVDYYLQPAANLATSGAPWESCSFGPQF